MMKQQIIVSGLGGQGVLFVTRVIAEAGVRKGLNVLTSETHGMAQRGGSVISTIKVGEFRSPLILQGRADAALFLHKGNLAVHRYPLRSDGAIYVNAETPADEPAVDATGIGRAMGAPVLANLVLLGFAVSRGGLFCTAQEAEEAIRTLSPPKFAASNNEGFRKGLDAGGA